MERLACRLLRHLGRCEPAEFDINERHKFLGSLGVALLDAVESPCLERIEEALALDPMVPKSQVREIGRAILAEHVH